MTLLAGLSMLRTSGNRPAVSLAPAGAGTSRRRYQLVLAAAVGYVCVAAERGELVTWRERNWREHNRYKSAPVRVGAAAAHAPQLQPRGDGGGALCSEAERR